MLELFMVTKRAMTLVGGEVRQPGELIPEAVFFRDRAKKVLQDADEMIKVIVVSQKEYKKLEGSVSAPSN